MQLQLAWWKCDGSQWCDLETVNLSNVTIAGVYLIWHGGASPRWVYVGQGHIATRLREHRQEHEILQYKELADYLPHGHSWDQNLRME